MDCGPCASFERHPRRLSLPGRIRPVRDLRAAAAFTIIELLVVLAIIAAVVGGIGLALRGGDETVALGSAQRTMSSLLTATRAQAIMNGTNARLIVHNDPSETEKYLRFAGIVREQRRADGTAFPEPRWVPTSEGTNLPRGTFFVPPFDDPRNPGGLFTDDWVQDNDAFSIPVGTFQIQYPRTPAGQDYVVEGSGHEWFYYEFGPNGEMTSGISSLQVVLTSGTRTATTPVFENPDNVRGLILRRIGTFHPVNARLTFHGTD